MNHEKQKTHENGQILSAGTNEALFLEREAFGARIVRAILCDLFVINLSVKTGPPLPVHVDFCVLLDRARSLSRVCCDREMTEKLMTEK